VYTITNPTDSPIDFELLRYIDGDLLFNGTFTDGGGRLFVNGLETYLPPPPSSCSRPGRRG
jgi:hypothetical protein